MNRRPEGERGRGAGGHRALRERATESSRERREQETPADRRGDGDPRDQRVILCVATDPGRQDEQPDDWRRKVESIVRVPEKLGAGYVAADAGIGDLAGIEHVVEHAAIERLCHRARNHR